MSLSEPQFDPLDPPPPVLAGMGEEDGPRTPFPCMPLDDGRTLYAAQAMALLPPGPAWPREGNTVLFKLVYALAQSFRRAHERFCALMREATPVTATELLGDWERVLGLPDACAPAAGGLAERRARVLQRLAAVGGQSRAYFIEVARALGFDILIEEFRPFQIGTGRAGDPIDGIAWRFAWRVFAPEVTPRIFHVGAGASGDRLSDFGNEILECVLNRLKPAHTILHHAYAPAVEGLAPLLWIDLAQSPVMAADGKVVRVDSIYGAPSDLLAQPVDTGVVSHLSLAPDGPDERTVLSAQGEADLVYAFDPPLPTLSGGFGLVLLVQGGPADLAGALGGSAYARLDLILGPRAAVIGAGAGRVALSDPNADPNAWRLVMLVATVENDMRRITLRRDGAVIAEATAPLGPLDSMVVLADRIAVAGLLTVPPDAERQGFIERRIARGWNIPLIGE
jgi:uncharacterized protein YmfQ (DUF2313 family)